MYLIIILFSKLQVLDRYGDVIVAYQMNGADLPAEHGYPVRVIVPGVAGVRNVKWLRQVSLAAEESHGTWQRGLSYKGFGPSVKTTDGEL